MPYPLISFCSLSKRSSLGHLSSVSLLKSKYYFELFQISAIGTKVLFSLMLLLLGCCSEQQTEHKGDLKPCAVTDHRFLLCRARSTLNLKADGLCCFTSGEGFSSESIQKPKQRSKERKVPKPLGWESSSDAEWAVKRIFVLQTDSLLCGLYLGSIEWIERSKQVNKG